MPQYQFLFSAIFGFRKVTREIFSKLDVTKAKVLIFYRVEAEVRRGVEEVHQGGHTCPRRGLAEQKSTKSSDAAVIINPSLGGF